MLRSGGISKGFARESKDTRKEDAMSLLAMLPCQDLLCAVHAASGELQIDIWQIPQQLPPLRDTELGHGLFDVLPTHVYLEEDVHMQPKRLLPSPDGSLLCILGCLEGTTDGHLSVVIVNIAAFTPVLWSPGKSILAPHKVLKLEGIVHEPVNVVDVAWHPLSTHHLTVLSSNHFVFVYDVSEADTRSNGIALRPVFECDLSRVSNGRTSCDFVKLCYPEQVSLSPWSALTLLLVSKSGSPFFLFPVTPRGLEVPAALSRAMLSDVACVTNEKQRGWCTGWCEEYSDSKGRPHLRFIQPSLSSEPEMDTPLPVLLGCENRQMSMTEQHVMGAVLMGDDVLQLALLMDNGIVAVRQCFEIPSLKWLNSLQQLRWTEPLIQFKLDVPETQTLSMRSSIFNPTEEVVVNHSRGCCVLHMMDLRTEPVVTTVTVAPDVRLLGAAHWMNASGTFGVCFSFMIDKPLMFTLCKYPECEVEQSKPAEISLELPPMIPCPDMPRVPIPVVDEQLEDMSTKDQVNAFVHFSEEFASQLEKAVAVNAGYSNCDCLKKQRELLVEEEQLQHKQAQKILADAKKIQQLLVHSNARQDLFRDQMIRTACEVRHIASSENKAGKISLDNAEAQIEAIGLILERLKQQAKELPDIHDISDNPMLQDDYRRLQEKQKDLQSQIDELLQRCFLPLP